MTNKRKLDTRRNRIVYVLLDEDRFFSFVTALSTTKQEKRDGAGTYRVCFTSRAQLMTEKLANHAVDLCQNYFSEDRFFTEKGATAHKTSIVKTTRISKEKE